MYIETQHVNLNDHAVVVSKYDKEKPIKHYYLPHSDRPYNNTGNCCMALMGSTYLKRSCGARFVLKM